MAGALAQIDRSLSSNTCAQTSNVTSGNLIYLGFILPPFRTITSVVDTVGTAYSAVGNVTDSATSKKLYIYTGYAAGSGSNTATVTINAGNPDFVSLAEFSGYAASAATDQTNSANGTNPAASVTTTAANEGIFGIAYCNGSAITGGTAGYTVAPYAPTSNDRADAYNLDVGAIGSKTLTFNTTTSGVMIMVSFKLPTVVARLPLPILVSQAVRRAAYR